MAGAYALRDEIIAKGEAQSTVFAKLFERLSENWKKQDKIAEDANQPEDVS